MFLWKLGAKKAHSNNAVYYNAEKLSWLSFNKIKNKWSKLMWYNQIEIQNGITHYRWKNRTE